MQLRVPHGGSVDEVALRYVHDGEPAFVRAERAGDTLWRARFPVPHPATHYRWLLAGGEIGYAWLNGNGLVRHDVPDADDFVLLAGDGGPAWHLESVVYEIFPDRFASSGLAIDEPDWAMRRGWDELPRNRGVEQAYELFGGDLYGSTAARPHRVARRERDLPHAVLPRGQLSSLRRDVVRPTSIRLLGGRRAHVARSLRPRTRHPRARRPDGQPRRHHARVVRGRAGVLLPRRLRARLRGVARRADAAEAESRSRRSSPTRCARSSRNG